MPVGACRAQSRQARGRPRPAQRDRSVLAELPLLDADVTDAASLRAVAQSSRVVISTVGPFIHYGEPLVAACAQAGTDYVDLSGEPEFLDRMYLRHHKEAVCTGARLVHACGFDSAPCDLDVFYTLQQLPQGVPVRIEGRVRMSSTVSGGSCTTALAAAPRIRAMLRAARERAKVQPRPAGRRAQAVTGCPRRDPHTGRWLVPLPVADPQIVACSAALLGEYGPNVEYRHFLSVQRLPTIVLGAAANRRHDGARPGAVDPESVIGVA